MSPQGKDPLKLIYERISYSKNRGAETEITGRISKEDTRIVPSTKGTMTKPTRIQSCQTQLNTELKIIILGKRDLTHRGQRDREMANQTLAPIRVLIAGAEAVEKTQLMRAMDQREAEATGRMLTTSSTKSARTSVTTE